MPLGAVRTGTLPSQAELRFDVVLGPRDPAKLTSDAAEVSQPGSPLDHQYLAKGQFPRLFGASRTAIANVRSGCVTPGLIPGRSAPTI